MRVCWLAAVSVGLLAVMSAACSAKKDTEQHGFGTTSLIEHSLEGKVYLLPNTTRKLPDFATLEPAKGAIYTATLNVPPTDWRAGFPGVTDRFEWFAIVYTGTIHAHQAGRYKFRSVSDDGSKVYIDDKLIVDNDGLHPVRSVAGDAELDTSPHKLRVEYMQGPRFSVALQVFCAEPGGKEKLFPACNLAVDTPGFPWWWLWLLLAVLAAIAGEETWRRRRKRCAQTAPPDAAISA